MFGDVFILIFLTAISEYDQVIDEDKTTNRIKESLTLFNTILNYPFFMDKDVIVFLNKTDLLKEKIEKGKSLVSEYFDEFTGDDHNVDDVQTFFKVMHYLLITILTFLNLLTDFQSSVFELFLHQFTLILIDWNRFWSILIMNYRIHFHFLA